MHHHHQAAAAGKKYSSAHATTSTYLRTSSGLFPIHIQKIERGFNNKACILSILVCKHRPHEIQIPHVPALDGSRTAFEQLVHLLIAHLLAQVRQDIP